jgi:hypothetical protein
VDSLTGRAVGAGFVVLTDEEGREVARTLTGPEGRFTLPAPSSGQYRLRSERIAYRVSVSPIVRLDGAQSLTYTLRVAALPIELSTIEIDATDRCRVRPEVGQNTAILWEEARKALAAASWSAQKRLYRQQLIRYEREVGLNRMRVFREETRRSSGYYSNPYRSVDAATLAEEGYVVARGEDTWFYAPDADVLLDDSFLATHCFRVERDAEKQPRMVGLAFEPVPGRDLPDIEGILWLDERAAELRVLEYRYTGLPALVRDRWVGGTVEFMALPSGAWIVRRWQIRTPSVGYTRVRDLWVRPRGVLKGFVDTGGEIAEITSRDGVILYGAKMARLTGTVYDSTRAAPLAGAIVRVVGTDVTAKTDSAGQFRLMGPLNGEYAVTFAHPGLDSLGFVAQQELVPLMPGSSSNVALTVPGIDRIMQKLCPQDPPDERQRVLVGVVTDSKTHTPLSGVNVVATWRQVRVPTFKGEGTWVVGELQDSSTTDHSGRYVLCGLPIEWPVTLRAVHKKDNSTVVSDSVRFWFERDRDEVSLMLRDGVPTPYPAPYGIWRRDLELHRTASEEDVSGYTPPRTNCAFGRRQKGRVPAMHHSWP